MDPRSIVLKSISCRGLKSFNLFQKPSAYASISIAAGNDSRKQQKQKTSADHTGGDNPEWDQTIQFDLHGSDLHDLFLEFAIKAQGNLLLFGDKLIGKSRVPITDLSLGHSSDAVRHVSYQIRSPEGKPNGVLSFSYSLIFPEMEIRVPPPLDLGIPSAPPMDDYAPPPAPPRRSLYPPLPLPEAEAEDCFCYYNQPPPPDPPNYYPPPPPPAAVVGYYSGFDRSVSSPVLSRDAYFSAPVFANGGYYFSPAAAVPPAVGAYYPSLAPGYVYPPPQESCGYWNCK